MKSVSALGSAVILVLSGCLGTIARIDDAFRGDPPVPSDNEIVMGPRTRITATTEIGTITITSGEGLRRFYTWEGATRSAVLIPRSERWYGSLGLYYAGPGDHWQPHNGLTSGVLEEGQQHFESTEDALKWMESGPIRGFLRPVYTDTGLLVGWNKDPHGRNQLSVEVWQIYIDGEKPTRLPGSMNDRIRLESVK